MSEVVRRLCEEFLKADLSAVYGRLCGFGASIRRMYLSFQAFYGAANAIYLNF